MAKTNDVCLLSPKAFHPIWNKRIKEYTEVAMEV